MAKSIGWYILKQSVSVMAVTELTVREAGSAIEYFGKDLFPVCAY